MEIDLNSLEIRKKLWLNRFFLSMNGFFFKHWKFPSASERILHELSISCRWSSTTHLQRCVKLRGIATYKDINHLNKEGFNFILVSKAIVCSFYIFYSTFGLNLYCIQSKQCRLLGWRIKILNKTQKHWKYFIIIFLRLINEQVRAVFIHNLMSKPWFKKKEFLNFSFTFLSDLISSGYHVRLKKVSFSYNLKML